MTTETAAPVVSIKTTKCGPRTLWRLVDSKGRSLRKRVHGDTFVRYFDSEQEARAYAAHRLFVVV